MGSIDCDSIEREVRGGNGVECWRYPGLGGELRMVHLRSVSPIDIDQKGALILCK